MIGRDDADLVVGVGRLQLVDEVLEVVREVGLLLGHRAGVVDDEHDVGHRLGGLLEEVLVLHSAGDAAGLLGSELRRERVVREDGEHAVIVGLVERCVRERDVARLTGRNLQRVGPRGGRVLRVRAGEVGEVVPRNLHRASEPGRE